MSCPHAIADLRPRPLLRLRAHPLRIALVGMTAALGIAGIVLDFNGWLLLASVLAVAGYVAAERHYTLRGPLRERRWQNGQCVACGFSLHGNTSGVCPECGTPYNGTAA